ncbi:MAG: hypothetical protein JWN95_2620 [Frankiales bacterium]|nr:hypothetical protein [Frankiales bacterium]
MSKDQTALRSADEPIEGDSEFSGRGRHLQPQLRGIRLARRGTRYALYAVLLAGLIGGTAAWATAKHTVELRVDGVQQQVHTSASSVKGVLAAANVQVGPHDLVAPDLSAHVDQGASIVVNRGHLLHLDADGKVRDVWVNASSVSDALDQLGYDTRSVVSVSRSQRLDSGTTNVTLDAPKKVTFVIGKKKTAVLTAGPTVYDAIADAGLYVGPADKLSATGTVRNNQVIRIQRVTFGQKVAKVSVPFPVISRPDGTVYRGTDRVITPGEAGSNRVTYQLIYVDGKYSGQVPQRTSVLVKPVPEVKGVGTKDVPAFVASVPAGSAQKIAAAMVASRGWDGEQFSCLVSLWNKESGWRTDAANPSGAYGIPQALPGDKMSTAGADWQTNPATQITWGLNYISGVYGTPCAAWGHSQATNWY